MWNLGFKVSGPVLLSPAQGLRLLSPLLDLKLRDSLHAKIRTRKTY